MLAPRLKKEYNSDSDSGKKNIPLLSTSLPPPKNKGNEKYNIVTNIRRLSISDNEKPEIAINTRRLNTSDNEKPEIPINIRRSNTPNNERPTLNNIKLTVNNVKPTVNNVKPIVNNENNVKPVVKQAVNANDNLKRKLDAKYPTSGSESEISIKEKLAKANVPDIFAYNAKLIETKSDEKPIRSKTKKEKMIIPEGQEPVVKKRGRPRKNPVEPSKSKEELVESEIVIKKQRKPRKTAEEPKKPKKEPKKSKKETVETVEIEKFSDGSTDSEAPKKKTRVRQFEDEPKLKKEKSKSDISSDESSQKERQFEDSPKLKKKKSKSDVRQFEDKTKTIKEKKIKQRKSKSDTSGDDSKQRKSTGDNSIPYQPMFRVKLAKQDKVEETLHSSLSKTFIRNTAVYLPTDEKKDMVMEHKSLYKDHNNAWLGSQLPNTLSEMELKKYVMEKTKGYYIVKHENYSTIEVNSIIILVTKTLTMYGPVQVRNVMNGILFNQINTVSLCRFINFNEIELLFVQKDPGMILLDQAMTSLYKRTTTMEQFLKSAYGERYNNYALALERARSGSI